MDQNPDKSDIEKEVMEVLDEFINAFIRLDLVAFENTFHFPHYRLARGRMEVLNSAGQMNESDLKHYLERISWHHSAWDRRKIIHVQTGDAQQRAGQGCASKRRACQPERSA
ncbi:hypothetical protein ACFL0Q_07935 [Thermodesulfobacteriota bacterium]